MTKTIACSLREGRRYFLRGYLVIFLDADGNWLDGIKSYGTASRRHYREVFNLHLQITAGIAYCVVELTD